MGKLAAFLRADSALVAAALQAVLAAVVAFGLHLTAGQAGGIEGGVSALCALIVAIATRPFHVAALSGFVTAIGTLLVAFKVPHVTPGEVSTAAVALSGLVLLVVSVRVAPAPPKAPAPRPGG